MSTKFKPRTLILWDDQARDKILRWLASLSLDPLAPLALEIREFEEPPTDDQRGYYHSVILKHISEHTGYRRHEVDKFLHEKFGPRARLEVAGEVRDVVTFSMSNKTGSKVKTSAFIDLVLEWARDELDCYIPPPRLKGDPTE